MQNIDEITLTPVEATAYWWVNVIKHKVKELSISGCYSKKERSFLNLFCNYTDTKWREIYIGLSQYLEKEVNNIVSQNEKIFSQDTDITGHDKINEAISSIIKTNIPDIRLADYSSKDSVIYTNTNYASVWYKSCGERMLSLQYSPDYILTGDDKEYNFYNLFIATLAILYQKSSGMAYVSPLREGFCEEYCKNHSNVEDVSDIEERFNQAFSKASESGIILGRFWHETYFCRFRETNYAGLEPYMDKAESYAEAVMRKKQDSNGTAYSKKMVPNKTKKEQ